MTGVLGDRILCHVIENAKEYHAASPNHRQAIDRIIQETAAAM